MLNIIIKNFLVNKILFLNITAQPGVNNSFIMQLSKAASLIFILSFFSIWSVRESLNKCCLDIFIFTIVSGGNYLVSTIKNLPVLNSQPFSGFFGIMKEWSAFWKTSFLHIVILLVLLISFIILIKCYEKLTGEKR